MIVYNISINKQSVILSMSTFVTLLFGSKCSSWLMAIVLVMGHKELNSSNHGKVAASICPLKLRSGL